MFKLEVSLHVLLGFTSATTLTSALRPVPSVCFTHRTCCSRGAFLRFHIIFRNRLIYLWLFFPQTWCLNNKGANWVKQFVHEPSERHSFLQSDFSISSLCLNWLWLEIDKWHPISFLIHIDTHISLRPTSSPPLMRAREMSLAKLPSPSLLRSSTFHAFMSSPRDKHQRSSKSTLQLERQKEKLNVGD